MTIWQLEQERQIGWKKQKTKKNPLKIIFIFSYFFFKEQAGFEPATWNLDFWVLLFYETLT